MNNCNFVGRLVRDGELRYIPGSGTPKITFCLAVDRDYKKQDGSKETDFINMELMGKRAEKLVEYLTKGKMISTTGSFRTNHYLTDAGEKRSYTFISVNNLNFIPTGKKEESKNKGEGFDPTFEPSFQAIDDDDIPF